MYEAQRTVGTRSVKNEAWWPSVATTVITTNMITTTKAITIAVIKMIIMIIEI